ncbi:MAG: DNA-directed RNA polymerase subunit omega [Proteobacteria bacterium]|jgi:DNA-directed RNA polymerase subunit omega|nr:DNA-directed RNA polymerase subunit omega [Alphaproteobacteria bacterium]NCC02462.1 DNA-directed RNA polymerase subunit omega [Pseudomonadota bacterium]
MARVTVEDCVLLVPNRFELVMMASHRARALSSGAELRVERDRDKNPVVALREIAEEKLDFDVVKESLIKGLQKRIEPDRPEDEVVELMSSEQQNWIGAADIGEGDDDFSLDMDEDEEEDGMGSDADFGGAGAFEDVDVRD